MARGYSTPPVSGSNLLTYSMAYLWASHSRLKVMRAKTEMSGAMTQYTRPMQAKLV